MGTHPLRNFRSRKGLTAAKLAELLGVTKATISRLESGKQKPSFALAMKIKKETDGFVTWEDFEREAVA
jgi:transcriptional regulator with XRE-family HTH domain